MKGVFSRMCTSIIVRYKGEGAVMARNMDYEHPMRYNIVYFPKDFHYAYDLYGKPLRSKYRMMGLSFNYENPLKDGVNEHGLMGCTNTFSILDPYYSEVDPNRKNISSLNYFSYALANYKDVPELIADLENIHISTKDFKGNPALTPRFHYFFADNKGNSIIIEPEKKELRAIENLYDVMTNSPKYSSHVKRLKKLMDPDDCCDFNSVKHLPGGYDPVSRFIKAFYMVKTHVAAKDRDQALENSYSILESLKMPEGFVKLDGNPDHSYTRYICAYDNKSCLLTVRSHTNPTIFSLSFNDFKGVKERITMEVPKDIKLTKLENF